MATIKLLCNPSPLIRSLIQTGADYLTRTDRQSRMRLHRVVLPLALFILTISTTQAQRVSIDYVLGTPETRMPFYDLRKLDFFHVKMPMSFGEDSLSVADRKRIQHGTVYQIDLVFSDFRSSSNFSQEDLNRRRLQTLQQQFPHLFNQTMIHWRLIRQTAADSKTQAKALFHGFVFHIRTPMIVDETEDETIHLEPKTEI